MIQLVLATHNQHKVLELTELLASHPISVVSVSVWPELVPPDETGATFAENAFIKASTVAKHTGCYALADDSGIMIDALDGQPGIHSARWAGPDSGADEWIAKSLALLKGVPPHLRTCRYVCALSLVDPTGCLCFATTGIMEGRIGTEVLGTNGFGYDPIFMCFPNFTLSAAQLTSEEKHLISHRGQALASLMEELTLRGLQQPCV